MGFAYDDKPIFDEEENDNDEEKDDEDEEAGDEGYDGDEEPAAGCTLQSKLEPPTEI